MGYFNQYEELHASPSIGDGAVVDKNEAARLEAIRELHHNPITEKDIKIRTQEEGELVKKWRSWGFTWGDVSLNLDIRREKAEESALY